MTIARTQMYRQLYQMGGIGSLPMDYGQSLQVPQQMQPSFSSAQNITMNPLLNYGQPQLGQAGGTPLTMANGGSANLVEREKYGLGSKLKKFVRNIIPNEIAEIAVKAAPFVAPFNPLLAAGMAGIGGFDQTGRIGSSLKSAALTYGAGQIARGIGGAGFQEGFNPFAQADFSGGFTSGIGSLFSSPMGTQPFGTFQSNTPTQNLIQTSPGYTGGADALTYDPTTGQQLGRTAQELQSSTISGGGISPYDAPARSAEQLVKTYGTPSGTEPGYIDLIKKAGSLENVPLSERFNAVKDLSSKALTDLYTKPIPGQPGKTQLDKTALYATFAGASSYIEARKLANKAGVPESEFNEADYQRLKIDPEKSKLSSTLKPGAFGIREAAAAEGGRIGYGIGDLVRSSGVAIPRPGQYEVSNSGMGGMIQRLIQQNPQMFRTQMSASRRDFIDNDNNGIDDREEAAGGGLMNEGVLSIKLTPAQAMAMGGRIGYQVGGIGGYIPQQNPFGSREETLEEAMARGEIFYDPITGIEINPLTGMSKSGTNTLRQPVQYQYSDRGTMIDQFGYQPGQLTPELQSQIDQYKRALNRVESSYGKKLSELGGPEQMTNPGAYGQTGGMPFTANQYLSKAYQSEQDAAARVTPKKAKGGRINYPMGNEIPVRQNQGGISELDLRAKGGYIPVGIKEKADDVPAMLSRNEFVFTADAVRGAGNGSINKGAQKMYKLMKSLEKKVKQNKVA